MVIDITKLKLTIDREEKVLKVIHVHPVFFFLIIFLSVVSLASPIIILTLLYDQLSNASESVQGFIIVFTSIYYLVVLTICYIAWIDFYLDIGIVTSERLIDIDQAGLLGRKVSQLYLINIQDVSANQEGLFANLFNYGNVLIQSAGSQNNFLWVKVPDPFSLSESLLDLHNGKKIMKEKEILQNVDKKGKGVDEIEGENLTEKEYNKVIGSPDERILLEGPEDDNNGNSGESILK